MPEMSLLLTVRTLLCAARCAVQRLARPWDSLEVELTFKPRISAKSKQLMAETRSNEGGGGFLDRLDNDMRRREAKQKVRMMSLAHLPSPA